MTKNIISFCLFCALLLYGQTSLSLSTDIISTYKAEQNALIEEIAVKTQEYEAVKAALETSEELTPEEHQVLLNQLEELDAFFTSANKELKDLQKLIKNHERTVSNSSAKIFTLTSLMGVAGVMGYGVKKLMDMLKTLPKTAESQKTMPENQNKDDTANVNNNNVQGNNVTTSPTSTSTLQQSQVNPTPSTYVNQDQTSTQQTQTSQQSNNQHSGQSTPQSQDQSNNNSDITQQLSIVTLPLSYHEEVQAPQRKKPLLFERIGKHLDKLMFSRNPKEHSEGPPLELVLVEKKRSNQLVTTQEKPSQSWVQFLTPAVIYNFFYNNEEQEERELAQRFAEHFEKKRRQKLGQLPHNEQGQKNSELIVTQPMPQKTEAQPLWISFKESVRDAMNSILQYFSFTSSLPTPVLTLESSTENKEKSDEEPSDTDKKAEAEQQALMQKSLNQQRIDEKLYLAHMHYGM